MVLLWECVGNICATTSAPLFDRSESVGFRVNAGLFGAGNTRFFEKFAKSREIVGKICATLVALDIVVVSFV
jgi:hypothetical protein